MGNFISNTWKDLTQPGWRQADKANEINQGAISAQADSEAYKRKKAQQLEDLAYSYLQGNGSTPGAKASADDWSQNYLSWLKTSPDSTFNRQSTSLKRSTMDAKNSLIQTMARRGLSTSGLTSGGISQLDMQQGRGIADLIGQAEDRKGQRLATGAQFTQDQLVRALNMIMSATTGQMGLSTQVPSMTQNYANNVANQQQGGGVIQSLIGNYAQGKANDWLGDYALANTAASGSGNGSSVATKALKAYFGTLGIS